MDAPPDCARCPRLVESRVAVVNGAGPLPSDVLIVAQNPGRAEEIDGEPLIGWSGRKLVFLASLAGLVVLPPEDEWDGLSKDDRAAVFAVARHSLRRENIIRCRPPRSVGGDDTPTPTEIKNCRPFLEQGIALANPKVIVTLGAPAWKWFNSGSSLSVAHGWPSVWVDQDYNARTVIPMYHPAAAAPHRRPYLEKLMKLDWAYLGEFLAGRGNEAKTRFIEDRIQIHEVR